MPSEVAKQLSTEVILLLTTGQPELPAMLVVPTAAGAMPPVEALPMQAEVAAAMTGGTQPEAAVAVPEAAARPAPPAAQVTAPDVGRTEGDAAEGSPRVVVLGERFMLAPLAPSITEGGVSTGTSW